MITQSSGTLLSLLTESKTIPIIESRAQFVQALALPRGRAIWLRHCNLFELAHLLEQARQRGHSLYVSADHLDGIQPDQAGLQYLVERFHIAGIVSTHPRTLALAKSLGLETIQRIFAADSTGLEVALTSIELSNVDLLDISPALVIPYVVTRLASPLPLPFVGSGLLHTQQQIRTVLAAGAAGVAVLRSELWRMESAFNGK